MQRSHILALIAVGALILVGTAEGLYRLAVHSDMGKPGAKTRPGEKHSPLYGTADSQPLEPVRRDSATEPIVIADCRFAVIDKQDVPSQRDGVLLFVGREVRPNEVVPEERSATVELGGKPVKVRRWKEGDRVLPGELLAQLDDRLARDECAIKKARVAAAQADLAAAEKTRDESKSRYETQVRLRAAGRATSEEELRSAKLNWDRYLFEAIAKKQSVALAEGESRQVDTMLSLHQVRCATPGTIKAIHKQAGEAVKSLEAVVQIHKLDRLRVEGVADAHHLPRLRVGMRAEVEPAESDGPARVLAGHIQDITAAAVSNDGRVVSADEGGSVRVWGKDQPHEDRIIRQTSAVRALACTGTETKANLCLAGLADGKAVLWDLDGAKEPIHEVAGLHRGAVTCAAFSPDGRYCVTGGEDREIVLVGVEKGEILYRFPAGHRAAVSYVAFTPRSQVVSAGRDNTIRVWQVGEREAELVTTFDRRGGEVAKPGVSRDGSRILFDQGATLRLLSLPEGRTEGVLRQATATTNFSGFALFSPDGRLVLTPAPGESGAVLWRSPDHFPRGSELRHLASPDGAAVTAAAFAPDGSFVVGAMADRRLLVWSLPSKAEIERAWPAEIVLVEAALDSNARQVRVWAELPNPDGRLLPGGIATLVVHPRKKADDKERRAEASSSK